MSNYHKKLISIYNEVRDSGDIKDEKIYFHIIEFIDSEYLNNGEIDHYEEQLVRYITTNIENFRNGKVWVNAYEVTRHYGGPEEGGWYYNNYEIIESKQVSIEESDSVKQQMLDQHSHINEGDIYSALGGSELRVIVELGEAESETRERPYYS